jgi:hypothetical protein
MGIAPSASSALHAHVNTSAIHIPTSSVAHIPFSVSPFKFSSFVSFTKDPSTIYHHTPVPTNTAEHCIWDWEQGATTCSSWTPTNIGPTSYSLPTGGYETTETSSSYPYYYTCTDFLCVDSVVSLYGFSLCPATSTTTPFGHATLPWTWTEQPTATIASETSSSCHPLLDWSSCPPSTTYTADPWLTDEFPTSSSTSSIFSWQTLTSDVYSFPTTTSTTHRWDTSTRKTYSWPTTTWTIHSWPTKTSTSKLSSSTSDCDSSTTSSIDYTIPDTEPTGYGTTTSTKHTYSYRRSSTRRTSTSTTSDCDFWDLDCFTTDSGELTTLAEDPDSWRPHRTPTAAWD